MLQGAPPRSGAEAEKRFPPLVVPPGFRATLFACDPLIEYPSVIALGPRSGTLLLAHDYMTGLGTEITRRDEIRLLEDTDGDGYADKSTVFAGNFNSLQGLAYFDGTVYAMHAPFLTALRDTNGDGKADERRDLLTGLGLSPEKNPPRLHCANGVSVGFDGWLYLAVGDHGAEVTRPEGDRFILNGGGLLRCRPDGRDLHLFAGGLRNVYDVVLDDELHVFLRDNENDGGDYLLRICQSFPGADHGYPYLYRDHPNEALSPLADLGHGSSAGGTCYLETAFPAEMRGDLFFCEWGRAVVRAKRSRPPGLAGFGPTKEVDFAAGDSADPYGFKPTDVIVDHDGSLLVSDWGDDQRPKRGRGRIYRISWTGASALRKQTIVEQQDTAALLSQLDSPSHHERVVAQAALQKQGKISLPLLRRAIREMTLKLHGRMHAVWIITATEGHVAVNELIALAGSDTEPAVRVQAIRAIADLTDPVFRERHPSTKAGDPVAAARLAKLAEGAPPAVLLETVITLGRLRWDGSVGWLRDHLKTPDSALSHAAQQTLRRSGNWPQVLRLLDEPTNSAMRRIALLAAAEQADDQLVDGLISRLQREAAPRRRAEYAGLLARVHRKPGAWTYWGYRPSPRPAHSVPWERTPAIATALDTILADPDRDVRLATLKGMMRDGIPIRLAALGDWLASEPQVPRVAAIVEALSEQSGREARTLLLSVAKNPKYSTENRLQAVSAYYEQFAESGARVAKEDERILETASQLEEGPVLAQWIRRLSRHSAVNSQELLLKKLDSPLAGVRAAALEGVSRRKILTAAPRVGELLNDSEVEVRRAAADAVGSLNRPTGKPLARLLELAADTDLETRRASLSSLRRLRIATAIPQAVAALRHPTTQIIALEYLAEFADANQLSALSEAAAATRSSEFLTGVMRILTEWDRVALAGSREQKLQEAIARLQGDSGLLLRWQTFGPLSAVEASRRLEEVEAAALEICPPRNTSTGKTLLATGSDLRVEFGPAGKPAAGQDAVWLASAQFLLAEPIRAEFLGGSNGPLLVRVDRRLVHERLPAAGETISLRNDSERFEIDLKRGLHHILLRLRVDRGSPQFQFRFRRLGSSPVHERLAKFVLKNSGNPDVGREIFLNRDKSHCLKCHSLNGSGAKIGPDLTGVGSRFSRIHLVESILEPSRTVAPAYEGVSLVLKNGRTVNGIKVAESAKSITVGDDQGNLREIPLADVDERAKLTRSLMPDGLEKQFTDREFVDLISFLISQKKAAAP